MKILKTYKLRIYPSKGQVKLMSMHFGSTRFVWNFFLAERKRSYLENKETLSYYKNCFSLVQLKKTDEYSWLREVNSQALQCSLQDLEFAYNQFFKKQKRFPKFKAKRRSIDSFRCPQGVRIRNKKLVIPKFQEGIKINIHRGIEGKVLFATVSKSASDKFFVAITCEVEHKPCSSTKNTVGIDLGIKDIAVCSDGMVFRNIKTTAIYAKKLSYEQRQLSKKQRGSGKKIKQKKRVALIHEKIRNIRVDNLHKITTKIIRKNQTIVVEDLNVKGIIKNRSLAKAVSDASWYELIKQLKYKSIWNGKKFIRIDRWFPSSKTCSTCGFINEKLTLKDRRWICPICETIHDRDKNASQNILKQGLKILSGSGAESDTKEKPG